MTITNRLKLAISPLMLHSASSVQLLRSTNNFNSLLPTVNFTPLKLYSAYSFNLHGVSSNIFHNRLRVRLSPIKSPILAKYKDPYKRREMYPSISKCNVKSCFCCKHVNCKSTIVSTVNGRHFSVINTSDIDWRTKDVIYVLTCSENVLGMQYIGQTMCNLKTRFREHLRKIRKPKQILFSKSISDAPVIRDPLIKFWYNQWKQSSIILIRLYDTKIFCDTSLNLNGSRPYRLHFHLVLMIIFAMKEIFLKCLTLMFLRFWTFENEINDLMVNAKTVISNANIKLFGLL